MLILCSCSNKLDCEEFKNGLFAYKTLGVPVQFVEITDSFYIEKYPEYRGFKWAKKSKIKWISDCEYILTPIEETSILDSQMHSSILTDEIRTKIIETASDFCVIHQKTRNLSKTILDTLGIVKAPVLNRP